MDQNENNEVEINLKEIMRLLLRKLWIIILTGAVFVAAAYLLSTNYLTPMYKSTTQIYVMSKSDSSVAITYSDLQTSSQLTKDYMTLITSRPVTETVIEQLNLDIKQGQLAELISVYNPSNTRVLDITITYSDPLLAKEIADAVRDAAAIHIKNVMNIDEINVVEDANIPEGPFSPNVKMNTIIGGLLGAFISTFIILVIYMLDDTIKTPDDIERYLGISVLSTIPMQKSLSRVRDGVKEPKKKQSKKAVGRI